ncbi:hypothetical protein GCM10023205_43390 [Yinghuangia aomiensis]|uniref:Uncharacterized protein n=1 Tax=Yinghuangia aomiensis TaxID=676205 RepID=A0ABP9HKG6_9ACTN
MWLQCLWHHNTFATESVYKVAKRYLSGRVRRTGRRRVRRDHPDGPFRGAPGTRHDPGSGNRYVNRHADTPPGSQIDRLSVFRPGQPHGMLPTTAPCHEALPAGFAGRGHAQPHLFRP